MSALEFPMPLEGTMSAVDRPRGGIVDPLRTAAPPIAIAPADF